MSVNLGQALSPGATSSSECKLCPAGTYSSGSGGHQGLREALAAASFHVNPGWNGPSDTEGLWSMVLSLNILVYDPNTVQYAIEIRT